MVRKARRTTSVPRDKDGAVLPASLLGAALLSGCPWAFGSAIAGSFHDTE